MSEEDNPAGANDNPNTDESNPNPTDATDYKKIAEEVKKLIPPVKQITADDVVKTLEEKGLLPKAVDVEALKADLGNTIAEKYAAKEDIDTKITEAVGKIEPKPVNVDVNDLAAKVKEIIVPKVEPVPDKVYKVDTATAADLILGNDPGKPKEVQK